MRVTVLASVLFSFVAAIPAAEPTNQDLLVAIEKQLKTSHEKAGPCVACIVVSKSDRYPKSEGKREPGKLGDFDAKAFKKANPTEQLLAQSLDLSDTRSILDNGYACGVVIDPAGIILTPYHVVEGATKIYVHLPGRVGSYADVHAADSRHDLATLKLIMPPENLTAIKFADVRLRNEGSNKATVFTGKLAVLMSNSYTNGFAVDKPSASLGSVTNILAHRDEMVDSGTKMKSYYYFGPFLQHDAKLNFGINGSALLNLDGEMIGLTTTAAAVNGERSPAFAFPADRHFRRVVEVLARGEEVEYGGLGVSLEDSLRVGVVTPNSPAYAAGIRDHDTITHVNGAPVNNYEELLLAIGSVLAGNEAKVTVERGNRKLDLTVALGKLEHGASFIASVRPEPVFGIHVDYDKTVLGVAVREIEENSPAATAFKKLGDNLKAFLITHVNGKAVKNPPEFYKAAKGQKSVKLTLIDSSDLKKREREVTLP